MQIRGEELATNTEIQAQKWVWVFKFPFQAMWNCSLPREVMVRTVVQLENLDNFLYVV